MSASQQKMPAATVTYALPMAEVSLWSGDESVGPQTKLWQLKQATQLRISEQAEVVERRLTGRPHPKRRIIITGYEIEMDALFDQDVQILEDGEYILEAKFTEAAIHSSGLKWIRRVFYGVQVMKKGSEASGVDAMKNSVSLVANFVEDETGND